MKALRLSLAAVWILATWGWAVPAAQESGQISDRPKGIITVEMLCVRVPQALAFPLIRQLRSAKLFERAAATASLDGLLAKRDAELLAWPLVTFHDHEKGAVNCVEEVRCASSYQAGSAKVYLRDRPGQPPNERPRHPGIDEVPVADKIETRNIGVAFEAEGAMAAGGKLLDLEFTLRLVGLPNWDRLTVEHERTTEKRTDKMIVEQPRFSHALLQPLSRWRTESIGWPASSGRRGTTKSSSC